MVTAETEAQRLLHRHRTCGRPGQLPPGYLGLFGQPFSLADARRLVANISDPEQRQALSDPNNKRCVVADGLFWRVPGRVKNPGGLNALRFDRGARANSAGRRALGSEVNAAMFVYDSFRDSVQSTEPGRWEKTCQTPKCIQPNCYCHWRVHNLTPEWPAARQAEGQFAREETASESFTPSSAASQGGEGGGGGGGGQASGEATEAAHLAALSMALGMPFAPVGGRVKSHRKRHQTRPPRLTFTKGEIAAMKHRELQRLCVDEGLGGKGSEEALRDKVLAACGFGSDDDDEDSSDSGADPENPTAMRVECLNERYAELLAE